MQETWGDQKLCMGMYQTSTKINKVCGRVCTNSQSQFRTDKPTLTNWQQSYMTIKEPFNHKSRISCWFIPHVQMAESSTKTFIQLTKLYVDTGFTNKKIEYIYHNSTVNNEIRITVTVLSTNVGQLFTLSNTSQAVFWSNERADTTNEQSGDRLISWQILRIATLSDRYYGKSDTEQ